MNQQLIYVAASYGIGMICFMGLIVWIRHKRLRSLQFLKQFFTMQDYESDSKK